MLIQMVRHDINTLNGKKEDALANTCPDDMQMLGVETSFAREDA